MPTLVYPFDFAELELETDLLNPGGILYRAEALARACVANGLEPATILADEDQAMSLIAGWYLAHRERGGLPNDVAEAVIATLSPRSAH